MMALLRKELRLALVSPLAAVSFAVFLFLTGFAFNSQLQPGAPGQLPEASMRGLMYFCALMLLFIVPLFSMRAFAEEQRLKTLEWLRSAPLSELQLVLGKFFGIWIFVLLLLVATLLYPAIMLSFGEPDLGPLLLSYLGLIALSAAFVALGNLISALVSSPLLAALLSFVSFLLLWFLGGMQSVWLQEFSLIEHLESFSMGVLDLKDLGYYVLLSVAALFLTVRRLEAERWK